MSGFAGAWMMTKLWKPAAAANRQQIGPVLVIRTNELPASKKSMEEETEKSKGDYQLQSSAAAARRSSSKGEILEGIKGTKKKEGRSSRVLSEAAVCMLMDRFAPS